MIYGTDVSSHQPEQFPLELPDGTPVEFVMIKVTQGAAYTNPKWKAQAAWARQHGLAVGFYHFGEAGDQKVHAARFLGILGVLYPGETLWYDWEDVGGLSATATQKDAFLLEVKRLLPGRKVGLYCNVDFWKNRDTTDYHGDALWIASWAPVEPPIEASWTVHQYEVKSGMDYNRAKFFSSEEMKVWGGKPEDPTMAILREIRGLVRSIDVRLMSVDQTAGFDRNLATARHDAVKESLDRLEAAVVNLGRPPDHQDLAVEVVEEMGRRFLSS